MPQPESKAAKQLAASLRGENMREYRVWYLHEDTPQGSGFSQTVTAHSADDAALLVLNDRSIGCPCCSPIQVKSVEERVYGKYKECPAPKSGWNSMVTLP